MILLTATAVGVLFGAGIYAMTHRDMIRLTGGTLLISNAAVLFLVAAAFEGGEAPMLPVLDPEDVADPLVQALALTAIVINFSTTVLLLRVVLTVEETHETLIMTDIAKAEEIDEAEEEKEARERTQPEEDDGRRDGRDGGKG